MNSNNTCIQDVWWLGVGEQPGSSQISTLPPRIAEERWVVLEKWHSFPADSHVWMLYRPPMSQINGWRDFPEELEQSFIINCTILDFAPFWRFESAHLKSLDFPLERTLVRARSGTQLSDLTFDLERWPYFTPEFEVKGPAFVRCERVLSLREIPQCFPEKTEPFKPIDFSSHGINAYSDAFESEMLIHGAVGTEGGGQWWIRTKKANSRVVLYAFEVGGQGLAEICNRPFAGND